MKAIARLKCHARVVKGLKQKSSDPTTLEERKDAEQFIIRMVQREVFSDEIKSIKQGKEVSLNKSTKLYKLDPFVDIHDILRVG